MTDKRPVSTGIEELIESYINQVFDPKEMIGAIEQISGDQIKKALADFRPTASAEVTIRVGQRPTVKMDRQPAEFEDVLSWAANGEPCLMVGPAGTGKGTMARNIARALEAEFFEVNAVQNSYELTGFMDANSHYVTTPFYSACKAASEGKKVVFLFDEMDCSTPECLKVFNEALSSFEMTFPNNEKLAFDNLVILAAANTYGTGATSQYVGNQLDASTLDRFAVVDVNYDYSTELAITGNDKELVDFVEAFRAACAECHIDFVCSYRSLKRIATMKTVMKLGKILKTGFFKSLAMDDLQMILNASAMKAHKSVWKRAAEALAKGEFKVESVA